MAKSPSNVVKFIVDSMSIMDTTWDDGIAPVAVCTSATSNTFVCTGWTATLNALAGMDIVVFSGTGSPAIRTIASNTATSGGSTSITITGTWPVTPTAGACAQVAPSATWVNLGIMDEVPLKLELKNSASISTSDLSTLQKAYELTFTASALQLLDSSAIEAFKNKNVWLKAHPSGSSPHTLILRNIRIAIESGIDLAVKGKAGINIVGTKYIQSIGDALTVSV